MCHVHGKWESNIQYVILRTSWQYETPPCYQIKFSVVQQHGRLYLLYRRSITNQRFCDFIQSIHSKSAISWSRVFSWTGGFGKFFSKIFHVALQEICQKSYQKITRNLLENYQMLPGTRSSRKLTEHLNVCIQYYLTMFESY